MAADGVISQLQLLLPDRYKVYELVQYHLTCLLWYHNSFHGGTFTRQLADFYDTKHGYLDDPALDLQWAALLFAVLTASISCGNKAVVTAWGFLDAEQETLSQQWLQAVVTCLNASQYMAKPSILSCQAIATLTMSAHLLGYSNQQSVFLASATRIAQSLGLNRLGDTGERSIEIETGRRLWSQLCSQDWFSIAFSECYLIHPLYAKSREPLHCNDETLADMPASEPTISSYCRFLHSIALFMPHLQDGIENSNTMYTKYEQVMKYDRKMRTLATEERPHFLCNVPLKSNWPCYVPWARRAAAISSSHKIIMIHRKFLSMSFTNPAFAFTRKTCIAASKTILKEFRQAAVEGGPVLWIHHAFSVAAGITLCLDMLHASSSDPSWKEHEVLVTESIELLRHAHNSTIAGRGVRLLSDLLRVTQSLRSSQQNVNGKRPADPAFNISRTPKRLGTVDIRMVMRDLREGMENQDEAHTAPTRIRASFGEASAPMHAPRLADGRSNPEQYAQQQAEYDFGAFAEAENLFSSLHAGFAGSSGDAFGSLLNLSQSYDYV